MGTSQGCGGSDVGVGVGADREGPGGSSRSLPCPLSVPSVNLVKWSSQGMLRMSPEAMSELFQPTITHIIQHIGGAWPVPVHGHPLSLSHPLSLCHPLSLDHSPALLLGAPHSWDHFHPWNPPPFLGVPSSRESFLSLGPSLSLWSPIAGTIPCLRDPPHPWDNPTLWDLLCPWDLPCPWNPSFVPGITPVPGTSSIPGIPHSWNPPCPWEPFIPGTPLSLEPSLSLGPHSIPGTNPTPGLHSSLPPITPIPCPPPQSQTSSFPPLSRHSPEETRGARHQIPVPGGRLR